LGETGVGVDVRREYLKSNNLGDRRRDILGAFLEHRFKLVNNRLTITPGVYVNQITDNKLAFFPGIDASKGVSETLGRKGAFTQSGA
jgi:iron complex outermembrane receptor protein